MSVPQDAIQADWENREFVETISSGVRRIAEFLNEFGEAVAWPVLSCPVRRVPSVCLQKARPSGFASKIKRPASETCKCFCGVEKMHQGQVTSLRNMHTLSRRGEAAYEPSLRAHLLEPRPVFPFSPLFITFYQKAELNLFLQPLSLSTLISRHVDKIPAGSVEREADIPGTEFGIC